MKNIKDKLVSESADSWEISPYVAGEDFRWNSNSAFMLVDTELHKIGFRTVADIKAAMNISDDLKNAILNLEQGQMYNNNQLKLYIRIK